MSFERTTFRAFRRRVLDYGKKAGRHDLPWRKTRDPYAILVSEVMLQQTQVHRVIPFYTRFIDRFPTPRALAKASRKEVLAAWSGLGYNRRAAFLHEAARIISVHHGGIVPRDYRELRALPGIGDYTAQAVRVFAFNMPEVLIETNVRAVFIHHFFPRGRSVSDDRLMPLIATALDRRNPRRWYAALMDYGSYLKATNPNPSRRSRHHVKQTSFRGSRREVRGAIVRAFLAGKTAVDDLRHHFGTQLDSALSSLERDGLVERHGKTWRLAEPMNLR